jgi:hypothetical protein
MIKKIFLSMLAVFFPWAILLVYDNPGGAVVSLIMQATVIGWPFATVWAWKLIHTPEKKKQE